MSTDVNNPGKLAFSSHCLPGSLAEQKEQERMVEFHRCKALREAEEESNKVQMEAQRHQKYLTDSEAHKERMHRDRVARTARGGYPRP